MKKLIFTLVTVSLVGAGMQSAKAGDCEWTVAGKVLTGIAAASIVANALLPHPACAPAPAYYTYSAPPVVYSTPASPVYVTTPAPVYVAASAPAVVFRAPMYVARAPVPSFRSTYGVGFHKVYRHVHW